MQTRFVKEIIVFTIFAVLIVIVFGIYLVVSNVVTELGSMNFSIEIKEAATNPSGLSEAGYSKRYDRSKS